MSEDRSSTGFNKEGSLRRKRFNQSIKNPPVFYDLQQAPGSASGPGGRRFESSRPDFSVQRYSPFRNNTERGCSRFVDKSSFETATLPPIDARSESEFLPPTATLKPGAGYWPDNAERPLETPIR